MHRDVNRYSGDHPRGEKTEKNVFLWPSVCAGKLFNDSKRENNYGLNLFAFFATVSLRAPEVRMFTDAGWTLINPCSLGMNEDLDKETVELVEYMDSKWNLWSLDVFHAWFSHSAQTPSVDSGLFLRKGLIITNCFHFAEFLFKPWINCAVPYVTFVLFINRFLLFLFAQGTALFKCVAYYCAGEKKLFISITYYFHILFLTVHLRHVSFTTKLKQSWMQAYKNLQYIHSFF